MGTGFSGVGASTLPAALELAERRSTFCGRELELHALERAWEGARTSGRREVALVSGEPGVGKTRLLARLGARLAARGAPVLYGRCREESLTPFGPIVKALESADGSPAPFRAEAETAARHGAGVDVLAELERVELDALDVAAEVARQLAEAGSKSPVLLLIDDLHWADRETVRLLVHLLDSGEPIVGLVIVAFRDSEIADGGDLALSLQRVRRRLGASDHQLGGLAPVELSRLTDRSISSAAERARLNVTRAIRRAISRVAESDPDLGAELDRSIRTGIFCVYEPLEGQAWIVEPRRRSGR